MRQLNYFTLQQTNAPQPKQSQFSCDSLLASTIIGQLSKWNFVICMVAVLGWLSSAVGNAQEYLNGIEWKRPPIVTPGETNDAPPSDAIVLFDGKDLSRWKDADGWTIQNGAMVAGRGQIYSVEEFGDCQLHIEWSAPIPAVGSGQGRGNSGVFLMGQYEVQVLDSFENETYFDGQAGAIYKQTPPLVNAMRKPGEWNVYDIFWTAPRFNEDDSLKSPAYITIIHNGVLIQNHFELKGDTPYSRPPQYINRGAKGPIALQDHGNPVRYRNIWVRELQPVSGQQVRAPFIRTGDVETTIEH